MLNSLDHLVAIAAIIVSVWAVFDVREQVKNLIGLERKRVFTKIRNDMVWLFIDPTNRSHPAEIAKGLEEFSLLSMVLDPKQTPDLTKNAVNNEVLMFADQLVKNGFATWKTGWDVAQVNQTIHDWQTAINHNRVTNILGKKQIEKSII